MKFKIEINENRKGELEIDDELIALSGDIRAQASFIGGEVADFIIKEDAAQPKAQA